MARALKIYDGGTWVTIPEEEGNVKVYDGAAWINIRTLDSWEGTGWRRDLEWNDPVEPPEPPPTEPDPSKTYILSPYTMTISGSPGGLSWARFNTEYFRGSIAAVKARIWWKSGGGSMSSEILGNGSGTYYRDISYDPGNAYKRVDYSISAGISEFNSGSATGYTIDPTGSTTPSFWISDMQLVITT